MVLTQNLTPQDLALAVEAEAHKPVTVEQQKLSPSLAAYIRAFVAKHPNFAWDVKLDRNHAHHDLDRIWPKLPGFEMQARRLRDYIGGVIAAAPVSADNPIVLLRISTVSPVPVIASLPEPNETAVIATFDGDEALLRRYIVPVYDELPTFDDMSIVTGLTVLCQPVPPLINQFSDNRPLAYAGGGGNMYGPRARDKILAGNDIDEEQIVEMPLGETYYMHLPVPHPAAMVSPSETSATMLSSLAITGAASMTALAAEESLKKTPEQLAEARERDQVDQAAHRQQEQTVAAVTQAEFSEAPIRPILRDLPAQDDASFSTTDRAQVELQLEQEAVREAENDGEITPAEAMALNRMPNAYEREEKLETEEQQHLPEAYLEGDEPNLRAAGQEIMLPEAAGAQNTEANNREENLPVAGRELELGQGAPGEVASARDNTATNEGVPVGVGETVNEAVPAGESTGLSEPAMTELPIGDESQQAAAEITGEPGGVVGSQPVAESVISESPTSEPTTSELASPEGEVSSVGTPEGETTSRAPSGAEQQQQQELNTSPDETTEPRANATVPQPVHVSDATHMHETPDLDATKSEASMQDVKNEIDQAHDQMPDTHVDTEQYDFGHQNVEHQASDHQAPELHNAEDQAPDQRAERLDDQRNGMRDEQQPDSPREGLREGHGEHSNYDNHTDEQNHPIRSMGVNHTVADATIEQGGSHIVHQLHHMHEAMDGASFAPHMRPDVGLMHGGHPADAYRALSQPVPVMPHNPALSSHPLTPPVKVSVPLHTSHMVQRMQPAKRGRGLSSVTPVGNTTAKVVRAASVTAAVIPAAVMSKKMKKRPIPTNVIKTAAVVKAGGQSKRKVPINNGPVKGGDLPAPELGGA